MIHTFRRRLALLSALLTGIALVAFGLGIWWLIHDIKIDRIDMEVRATAEREASRSRSPDDWQRIEAGCSCWSRTAVGILYSAHPIGPLPLM